ncbi:hypothetical protein CHLRE_03g153300v5 [Chlamydomonas reinhardtii]|uniref:Uncharacterized protein n=1 Tax=Chlamydomonas reinhardtii TaxID=3055 RepID=A0A2K3DVU0_CHLRE|nr:uncharacterized protein CHLRE_03g153300v5 [Chlamydomonas reinhardtii]PNW84657.1 hypothetical protein CHLRE_03g153300v5 [Chlamydomonas reinhardtii]
MPALPLPGVLPTGLEVPGQHHAGGIRLVSECAVCGHSPNWPELQLGQWPPIYHLRAVALILNDALHMPDLLRLAEADPDTAKKVVGAMCSPAGTRSPWQLAGKPLCCCFPCPCCERVLPYGTAHRHMLAALLHPQVWKQLTPRQHARVQQIEQLPQPADTLLGAAPHDVMPPELSAMDCLELMRGMLLGVMAVHHSALRGTERCLCGADRMTELEVIEQRAALAGLQAAGTSLAAASELPSSRQGSAAAVAAVAAATAAAATAAAAAATAPAGRGVVEAGEAAVSQRVPLALPPPGMVPSGLEDMPSLLQQAARAATQSWPPLPAGGGRPGLPGAVARAPPLPTSLLAGGAGLRLQQQRQLVDMNQRAAGALAADGDSSGRRGQPHYGAGAGGSVEPALVYGGGRAVSLGNGRAGPPGETGQRGWDPPMGALLQHLARASASTQPTAAPAARPPAAAAAAPSAPQRWPPPRPTVDEAAGPLDGLEEQGGVPGGGAGAFASLQLVTALLKQLPREQLQHVLREVKAEADDDLAAGAGEAGAAGGTLGANIPPYLAEQLAASGVDLTSRPVQAPRQQQRQRQGRNVAPASSSVAGPGPAGGALGAGRGSSGQRSRQQDRDAAEEDALSVLMTLRDQGM